MTGTLHIVLAMKPIEGNFVQNAFKHGVAGLNIDGARIGFASEKDFKSAKFGTQTDIRGGGFGSKRPSDGNVLAKGVEADAKGRWPSNVLLGHLSGCKKIGVKKVSGTATSNGDAEIGKESNGVVKSLRRGKFINRTIDGKETVDAWECQEGCPIKAMDKQSGNKCGAAAPVKGTEESETGQNGIYGRYKRVASSFHDDGVGGASRFFKQVKGD